MKLSVLTALVASAALELAGCSSGPGEVAKAEPSPYETPWDATGPETAPDRDGDATLDATLDATDGAPDDPTSTTAPITVTCADGFAFTVTASGPDLCPVPAPARAPAAPPAAPAPVPAPRVTTAAPAPRVTAPGSGSGARVRQGLGVEKGCSNPGGHRRTRRAGTRWVGCSSRLVLLSGNYSGLADAGVPPGLDAANYLARVQALAQFASMAADEYLTDPLSGSARYSVIRDETVVLFQLLNQALGTSLTVG